MGWRREGEGLLSTPCEILLGRLFPRRRCDNSSGSLMEMASVVLRLFIWRLLEAVAGPRARTALCGSQWLACRPHCSRDTAQAGMQVFLSAGSVWGKLQKSLAPRGLSCEERVCTQ